MSRRDEKSQEKYSGFARDEKHEVGIELCSFSYSSKINEKNWDEFSIRKVARVRVRIGHGEYQV
jgi:anti-sigma28 factor (negative regulator of flagellin synthesis)